MTEKKADTKLILQRVRSRGSKGSGYICPVCGKRFYITSEEWVYRRGKVYFCSWSCLCVFDRTGLTEKYPQIFGMSVPASLKLPRRETMIRNDEIYRRWSAGEKPSDLALEMGLQPDSVRRILREERDAREERVDD